MITSFMPEIYAMTASALKIWVICSEYKLINMFKARGSLRCISRLLRRTKYKKFHRGSCPRTPLNGLINILFSLPTRPPSSPIAATFCWWAPCFQASALHRFFLQFSHHRHRHRFTLFPRSVKYQDQKWCEKLVYVISISNILPDIISASYL